MVIVREGLFKFLHIDNNLLRKHCQHKVHDLHARLSITLCFNDRLSTGSLDSKLSVSAILEFSTSVINVVDQSIS